MGNDLPLLLCCFRSGRRTGPTNSDVSEANLANPVGGERRKYSRVVAESAETPGEASEGTKPKEGGWPETCASEAFTECLDSAGAVSRFLAHVRPSVVLRRDLPAHGWTSASLALLSPCWWSPPPTRSHKNTPCSCCHSASGQNSAKPSNNPKHLSETNSRAPFRPRSFRCCRNAVQPALSSFDPPATAKTSRNP